MSLVTGNVGALCVPVAFGAVGAFVGSISGRVFLSLSRVGGLGTGGRQEHSRRSGQPKIRAGQFHATKVTCGCQISKVAQGQAMSSNEIFCFGPDRFMPLRLELPPHTRHLHLVALLIKTQIPTRT